MEIPQKLKIELTYDPAFSQCIPWRKNKTLIQTDMCTCMFTAVLFTIAEIRKQPMSIHRGMDKEDVTHTHRNINAIHKKNEILSICNIMDKSKGYYAK